MASPNPLRFFFTLDGRTGEGAGDMSVTYVGRVNRKLAEADARRRFEEWRQTGNPLHRKFSRDQIVVA
ncbi:MAG: hypothetical protein ACM33T_04100 [Solirubrobacterales bacterium]